MLVRLQPGLGLARTVNQITRPLLIGGAIGATILHGIDWAVGFLWAVLILQGAMLVIEWQQRAGATEFGRWQERNYVMASIKEALDRGMSPMEWMDGYVDRTFMEAGIPIPHDSTED